MMTAEFGNNEIIRDEVKISVSTDSRHNITDISFNNPEPIALPNNMSFYLTDSESAGKRFNTRTISKLSTTGDDYTLLPFTISIPELSMIQFRSSNMFGSLDYQKTLVLGGNEYPFHEGTVVDFNPTALTFSGQIKIANFTVSEVDRVSKPQMTVTTFPNPFNPITNIAFTLPKATEVEVNIYNIRGQRVRNLSSGMMNSGNHVISWNGVDDFGRSSSSGVYLISVNAKDVDRIIRKVTLLK